MMIRGNSIQYSSGKKKRTQEEEVRIENEIKTIKQDVMQNFDNISEDNLQLLDQKKERLNQIRNEKLEGVMLRSRSRYEDLGEKPTNYFFKLENRNYTSKVISRLVDDEGNEYNNTKEILNCQKNFYTNLYSTHNVVDDEPLESKIGVNSNKLENEEAEKLEGEILYTELRKALKTMKNNKTPGPDGFTVEFFKFFG